jgi:hypothetical protein
VRLGNGRTRDSSIAWLVLEALFREAPPLACYREAVSGDRDPFATAYVLAAIAAGDGAAQRGAMAQGLAEHVRAVLEDVRGSMQRDRGVAVSGLARVLTLEVGEAAPLSPRARGIVATLVPKELGARWMREAPSPRAGFRTSAALRRTLVALAEPSWRD